MRIAAEAENDIHQQDGYNRHRLSQEIRERLSPPRDQDNIRYVDKPDFGIEFHRLKLKNNMFDHRVYFDYVDAEVVPVPDSEHDYSYTADDLAAVTDRISALQAD